MVLHSTIFINGRLYLSLTSHQDITSYFSMYWSKSQFQPQGKVFLIIGASQGVGADLALRLYEKGGIVILVARTESKLKEQVNRIVKIAGEQTNSKGEKNIEYYVCDVANYDSCHQMWSHLIHSRNMDPDFIFCCAGTSVPKLFADLTGKELANGVNINYMTALNTVHAGFKSVVEKHKDLKPQEFKKRHIILFSSVLASYSFTGYAQYAPMKAALVSLSNLLRQEMGAFNYRVTCVYPGNFESEGYFEEEKTKPAITKKIEGASKPISSLHCCDIILDQLSKGYDSIYTDFIGWVLGCSSLNVNPRNWGLFQVIVAFIFLIIAPVAESIVSLDVKKFFQEKKEPSDEQSN